MTKKPYKTVKGVRVYPGPEPKKTQNKFVINTEQMISELESVHIPYRTFEFFDSLRTGFQHYGELTDKQYISLERIYNKYIHGIPYEVEGSGYRGNM